MKRALRAAMPLLVVAAIMVLTGCGTPATAPASPRMGGAAMPSVTSVLLPAGADVELAPASFVQTSVTVQAGQVVRFVDPAATGGPHLLCLGHNQQCDRNTKGPAALMGAGIRFRPGDAPTDVVFDTLGTYEITCLLHPIMNLTVTVR